MAPPTGRALASLVSFQPGVAASHQRASLILMAIALGMLVTVAVMARLHRRSAERKARCAEQEAESWRARGVPMRLGSDGQSVELDGEAVMAEFRHLRRPEDGSEQAGA